MNEKTMNNKDINAPALFELGPIQVTAMARQRLSDREKEEAVVRHVRGDWGRIGTPARIVYHGVLRAGRGSIMSIYDAACGVEFAIVTDFNAGRTEIALMDEIVAGIPRM